LYEGEWYSEHFVKAEHVLPSTLSLLQFGYPTLDGAFDFTHRLPASLFSLVGSSILQAVISFTLDDSHSGIHVGIPSSMINLLRGRRFALIFLERCSARVAKWYSIPSNSASSIFDKFIVINSRIADAMPASPFKSLNRDSRQS